MRRFVLAVVVVASVACTAESVEPETEMLNEEMVSAAESICPMMWEWQLSVGSTMNEMSRAAYREDSPDARLEIYHDAIERSRLLMTDLRDQLAALPANRFEQFFRSEIERELNGVDALITAAQDQVINTYQIIDEPTYRDVVPTLFVAYEKVIDVAKPELGSYGDPDLIPAFESVGECQYGVKDATGANLHED